MKSRSAYDLWNEIEQKASLSSQGIYKMVYTTNYLDVFFESDNFKELDILIHFDDITGKYIDINLKGIEIHTQIKTSLDKSQESIVVKNKDIRNNNLFKAFSATLFDNLEKAHTSDESYQQINKTIEDYKAYFNGKKGKCLSEIEQQGLFGELSYINEQVDIGNEDAIKYWEGMNKNKHDFVYQDHEVEIKTTKNQSRLDILISNENQLDDSQTGDLKLAVYRLEKVEAGISVFNLYQNITKKISNKSIADTFQSKVIQAGLNIKGDEDYIHFRLNEKRVYKVTSEFPKISRSMLPASIFEVKYHINLDGIEDIEDERNIYKN